MNIGEENPRIIMEYMYFITTNVYIVDTICLKKQRKHNNPSLLMIIQDIETLLCDDFSLTKSSGFFYI